MTSGPSATFFGSGNGTGVVAGSSLDLAELKIPARPQSRPRLSREDPFGLTVIIGGTNVRFCISPPGRPEPLVFAVSWQELSGKLSPRLAARGVDFSNSHDFLYPILAKRFIRFLSKQFDGPLPIENLCSLNFSIAGRVCGDERHLPGLTRPVHGIDAEVSTTNTGLNFSQSRIGRDLFNAMRLQVPSMRLVAERVLVVNDARAGLEGEIIHLGAEAPPLVELLIDGTGLGGDSSDGEFNEDGHRIIKDYRAKKTIVLRGDQIKEVLNPDGTYKDLPEHQTYAENLVAGPWVAIRFLKSLQEKPSVMDALARRIAAKSPPPKDGGQEKEPEDRKSEPERIGEILGELYQLADLQHKDRTRWAVNTKSFLLREINELIFQPNHRDNRRAMPCNFQIDPLEHRDPDKALVLLAWGRQKSFFKDLGEIIGAKYEARMATGKKPDKIILAGGLGEMFNRYSPEDRQDALDLIVEHANLPPGVLDFSRLSPEARECALAYVAAEEAKKLRESKS